MTKKSIVVGSRVEIIGDYRGFLEDLEGYVGEVRGIYECRGETRYVTYLPRLDEYVEPSIRNVKLTRKRMDKVKEVDAR